jgi:hypothetical protein
MLRKRTSIAVIAIVAITLVLVSRAAMAFDESRYPDWSGQWKKGANPAGSVGNPWDPAKPSGRAQNAPLTPEYQAIFEQSLADQDAGRQGGNSGIACIPLGMPRIMTVVFPMEIIITPIATHMIFDVDEVPRRIYTDGRDWPKDEAPSFNGYSVGKWVDENGDGRYDVLQVETRYLKGPRQFESSGLPLHVDNETIVKERLYLDKTNRDVLHDEVTTIDHALTRPWTVNKAYARVRDIRWVPYICSENNIHVLIGKEDYLVSADGYLMPVRKDQAPPDLRYFKAKTR